jgi:hypothetical protein
MPVAGNAGVATFAEFAKDRCIPEHFAVVSWHSILYKVEASCLEA